MLANVCICMYVYAHVNRVDSFYHSAINNWHTFNIRFSFRRLSYFPNTWQLFYSVLQLQVETKNPTQKCSPYCCYLFVLSCLHMHLCIYVCVFIGACAPLIRNTKTQFPFLYSRHACFVLSRVIGKFHFIFDERCECC